jgi:hypothetical protein
VLKKADGFPEESAGHGIPIIALVQDYQSLPLPALPNAIDFDAAAIKLDIYYRRKNLIVKKLNDIDYIQGHLKEFVNPQEFNLAHQTDDLQGEIESVGNCSFELCERYSGVQGR